MGSDINDKNGNQNRVSVRDKISGVLCCYACPALPFMTFFGLVIWTLVYFNMPRIPKFKESVVKVQSNQGNPIFYYQCRPHYFAGFNTHDLVMAGMLDAAHFQTKGNMNSFEIINKVFQDATRMNLNVARLWAHSNNKEIPFQISPGVYNRKGLAALDYTLEVARRHNVKIILSFLDNWKYYNGVDQFVDWSSSVAERTFERPEDPAGDNEYVYKNQSQKEYEVERHAQFFNDTNCKQIYKNHVATILNRINIYNGRQYKEDPTIFALDLINEPRCETWKVPECDDIFRQWVLEMSTFVKSLDHSHLLTIGSEGFWRSTEAEAIYNPQDWAGQQGVGFNEDGEQPNIDFLTVHVWPNNWNQTSLQFQRQWISKHLDVSSRLLHKPVLLEEFGKKLNMIERNDEGKRELRDPVYTETYGIVENSIHSNLPITGSLFWRWDTQAFADDQQDSYAVGLTDSTAAIIKRHAQKIKILNNGVPPGRECEFECWIPVSQGECENVPSACEYYHESGKHSESMPQALYFTSEAACCQPGLGAFENGCRAKNYWKII